MRLLCIGHSALDTIFRVAHIPREPTKVLASERLEAGGGMAANASVAAQRLGATVSYCGRVGDDDAGARILAELVSEGVDVSRVRRVDHIAGGDDSDRRRGRAADVHLQRSGARRRSVVASTR